MVVQQDLTGRSQPFVVSLLSGLVLGRQMAQISVHRRMAILAADVAGFSALLERDEVGTCVEIALLRHEIVVPILAENRGRSIKVMDEGFIAEFASPLEALRCGISIQRTLAAITDSLQLHIGLTLGDAIVKDSGEVHGEGVDVAARLKVLAEPGGILISSNVYDEVIGKIDAQFEDRGDLQLRNIARVVRVYAVIT
jgi:adenylate cyclase